MTRRWESQSIEGTDDAEDLFWSPDGSSIAYHVDVLVGAFGLCVAVLVIAPEINGAKRWFVLGPASFQPSELAKITIIVWNIQKVKHPEVLDDLQNESQLVRLSGFHDSPGERQFFGALLSPGDHARCVVRA